MTRPTLPSTRIAELYRQRIRDGELAPGDRLPTIRELVDEHGVASATVRSALSWLRVEGYIVTTQRGSFVADTATNTATPRDRLDRIQRSGSVLATGETKQVTAAELIVPPLYVAELFDVDPGSQVVRREYVVGAGAQRLMLAVDWYPASFADSVPDLLSTVPGQRTATHPGGGNDLMQQIERTTGRRVLYGRDSMHARVADHREAGHLGVPVGASILAGAHEWSDDEGVICYGEWCLPQRITIGYEYRV
ncbi:GntR family transcriptional regulator [Streptomyces pini]|uniref:GntR family transcriptional regulator n=1 Tax=Streptomyces pini TaxID=1520580 RepID=A0A1I4BWV7_9ACTN|nr:GntR family transcriptional regulator [Streptomyces pini]SFK72647.1 GntR family transcriptional regulator [Streptomyces pini]